MLDDAALNTVDASLPCLFFSSFACSIESIVNLMMESILTQCEMKEKKEAF